MAKSRPHKLVIDSDVTGSAGQKQGTSLACAQFMEAVRDSGHRTVMTDVLFDEWKRHRSNFAAEWLRKMYGAKKVDYVLSEPDEKLRCALSTDASPKDADAMLKDVHLLEAALATEMRIISREVNCRRCFRIASARVEAVRGICWVNPTLSAEEPVDWLRRGAPLDAHRLLGAPTRYGR